MVRMEQLPLADLRPLLEESRAQGFEFLNRLWQEYQDGSNRFLQSGEALFGVYHDQHLIAIGGLNRDPYLDDGDTGRVRHVYVLAIWRGRGVGRKLVERIIDEAKFHYRRLTLRTMRAEASAFYRALGFQTEPAIAGATLHMLLDSPI